MNKENKLRFSVTLGGLLMANNTFSKSEMQSHYRMVKVDNPTYKLSFDEHCTLFLSQQIVSELLERA